MNMDSNKSVSSIQEGLLMNMNQKLSMNTEDSSHMSSDKSVSSFQERLAMNMNPKLSMNTEDSSNMSSDKSVSSMMIENSSNQQKISSSVSSATNKSSFSIDCLLGNHFI